MKTILDLLTTVAAVVAVVLAGFAFARNSDGPSPTSVGEVRTVDDWEEFSRGGHRLGDPNASVVVVEFGDYECPACRNIEPWMASLRSQMGDSIAFVYRHFPLDYHSAALPGSAAAVCAANQGRFLQMHTLLLENSGWLVQPSAAMAALASQADVPDAELFMSCLEASATADRIERDRASGVALGIPGTPGVLVNDRLLPGIPDSSYLFRHVSAAFEETGR